MSKIRSIYAQVKSAPLRVRIVLVLAVLYLLSPIDIIPDFIPVIGQMDDILVIAWVMKYVKKHIPDFKMPQ